MLFQVLCGFEPIFYTTHPNEEPYFFYFFTDLNNVSNYIYYSIVVNNRDKIV